MDERGKILEVSDGFGIHKIYDYDEYDRLKVIQTAAGSSYFTYDDGGNLRMIVDPRGFTTSYDHDIHHNLKEVADAEGGSTSYEYNLLNQLTHVSLPNGTCKMIKYDGLGRLEQEIWGK
jgi:YD repeat-containing protein